MIGTIFSSGLIYMCRSAECLRWHLSFVFQTEQEEDVSLIWDTGLFCICVFNERNAESLQPHPLTWQSWQNVAHIEMGNLLTYTWIIFKHPPTVQRTKTSIGNNKKLIFPLIQLYILRTGVSSSCWMTRGRQLTAFQKEPWFFIDKKVPRKNA